MGGYGPPGYPGAAFSSRPLGTWGCRFDRRLAVRSARSRLPTFAPHTNHGGNRAVLAATVPHTRPARRGHGPGPTGAAQSARRRVRLRRPRHLDAGRAADAPAALCAQDGDPDGGAHRHDRRARDRFLPGDTRPDRVLGEGARERTVPARALPRAAGVARRATRRQRPGGWQRQRTAGGEPNQAADGARGAAA